LLVLAPPATGGSGHPSHGVFIPEGLKAISRGLSRSDHPRKAFPRRVVPRRGSSPVAIPTLRLCDERPDETQRVPTSKRETDCEMLPPLRGGEDWDDRQPGVSSRSTGLDPRLMAFNPAVLTVPRNAKRHEKDGKNSPRFRPNGAPIRNRPYPFYLAYLPASAILRVRRHLSPRFWPVAPQSKSCALLPAPRQVFLAAVREGPILACLPDRAGHPLPRDGSHARFGPVERAELREEVGGKGQGGEGKNEGNPGGRLVRFFPKFCCLGVKTG
jgi:hypothetical protein